MFRSLWRTIRVEILTTPPTDSNQSSNQLPDDAEPAQRRALAIVTACAILALPIGYLIVHYGMPAPASTGALPVAAPVQSIARLEESVRVHPTVSNRIDLAMAYIQANRPGRAIPILDSLLSEDGSNAVAWNNLCVANIMRKAFAIAIKDCSNAIRIVPDFQLARRNLQWAEDEKKKAFAALAAQEEVARASRNADFYLAQGLSFLHVGDYDQAIKAGQRVLELDPTNGLAANNIGTAYMFKKDPKAAVLWFEKAIALAPTLQIAVSNLAWAHDEQAKPSAR